MGTVIRNRYEYNNPRWFAVLKQTTAIDWQSFESVFFLSSRTLPFFLPIPFAPSHPPTFPFQGVINRWFRIDFPCLYTKIRNFIRLETLVNRSFQPYFSSNKCLEPLPLFYSSAILSFRFFFSTPPHPIFPSHCSYFSSERENLVNQENQFVQNQPIWQKREE